MGDEEVKVYAQCHGCKFTWDDMPDADICLKYPDGKPDRIVCGNDECRSRSEGKSIG